MESSKKMLKNDNNLKNKSFNDENESVYHATNAIDILNGKINKKESKIQEMMDKIAENLNEVETKKYGFKQNLNRKKKEMSEHYQEVLEEVQSKIAIQLSENETLAKNIECIKNEIHELLNKDVDLPKANFVIDYSKRTEKTLKQKELEIKKQCTDEFYPLFERVEEEHKLYVDKLIEEHQLQLKKINDDALDAIQKFRPRVFITQEEIASQQRYDLELANENENYMLKKNDIESIIKQIEDETNESVRNIYIEAKTNMKEERKNYMSRFKEAKSVQYIPKEINLPNEYDITPEQEAQFKKKAEQRLKDEYEQKLQRIVDRVSDDREKMKKDMVKYESEKIETLTEVNEKRLSDLNTQYSDQIELESKMNQELKILKERWASLNDQKLSNDELLSDLRGETYYYKDKIKKLDRELGVYHKYFEEEEEDLEELSLIKSQLNKLLHEFETEKRHYQRHKKIVEQNHERSLQKIDEKVEDVKKAKDQVIESLKKEISETKNQIKSIGMELAKLLNIHIDD